MDSQANIKQHITKHVEYNDALLLVCCLNSQQHFSHVLPFSQHPRGLYNLQQTVQEVLVSSKMFSSNTESTSISKQKSGAVQHVS
jgi:hypothetical protein